MPEFHGHVVDARTGAPIAGAIVKRELNEYGGIAIGDGARPLGVKGGDAETRTDADGRFVLPPFKPRRYTGMAWAVYKPGWMPAYSCYSEPGWTFGGCSGFGMPGNDPWTSVHITKSGDRVDLELRVFPPTLEGVSFRSYNVYTKHWVTITPTPEQSDPWGQYFERLNSLSNEHWLSRDTLLSQALEYLEDREPTRGMLHPLTNLADSISPYARPGLRRERCIVLRAIARLCTGPNWTTECDLPAINLRVRQYTDECVSSGKIQ